MTFSDRERLGEKRRLVGFEWVWYVDETDVMKIKRFHLSVFFDLLLIYAIYAAPGEFE